MLPGSSPRTFSIEQISPVLQQLRWLHIKYCIDFKIIFHNYTPTHTLRSSSSMLLSTPLGRRSSMGTRAFSRAASGGK
ncbi:unnamed protein product [Pleuronectes platessa]|uniref:Uncharacterized protein n=1 Tax=Pleuronectes platessa TaxID=8262 RepID=A0A9N7UGM1_PLEPL|nr:unnamed protein product [Pleuronectes platessa]